MGYCILFMEEFGMTEKQLTKRMEALTNLAHYSTEICLKNTN